MDAKFCSNQLTLYYLNDDGYAIVKDFNSNPDEFNFQVLIDRLDVLGGGGGGGDVPPNAAAS